MFEQGNYPAPMPIFGKRFRAIPTMLMRITIWQATYHRIAKQSNRPVDFQQAESFYQQCLLAIRITPIVIVGYSLASRAEQT